MKIYGFRPQIRGYGPRVAAALKDARKNVDGTLDGRSAIARELKLSSAYHHPAEMKRLEASNGPVEEISQRPFPKALRPTHVFRDDGGHMPYEAWMGNLPYVDAIVGMMFEDGKTVGKVP